MDFTLKQSNYITITRISTAGIFIINSRIMLLTEWVEQLLPNKKIDIFGKDGLLMNSTPYYLLSAIILLALSLLWNHAWALIVIVYAVLPLFDELFTQDLRNPTEQ